MRTLCFFALVGLAGCAGQAPADPPPGDAGGDGETPTSFLLSGKVIDYFGNVALGDATVTTDGLEPSRMTTSAADGAYQLDVAVGSALFLVASKTDYRATRSQAITVADMPVVQAVYVTSSQDVRNQYTAVGATAAARAMVVAELRRNNNTPLEGIPLGNVQLLDANNVAVTGVLGPFFFNAAGNVDNAITTAAAFQGRSRVAYLDVPEGTYTLSVSYPNNMGGNFTIITSLATFADGTTLVLSGGVMGGGGGGGGANLTFAANVYPKLQRAALGGLGCANCHTLSGPAAFLKFDEPAATVLASLTAGVGDINTTTPADSLILKRPLYEQPPAVQDHPNATFLDTNDADYKTFLQWIMQGAKP